MIFLRSSLFGAPEALRVLGQGRPLLHRLYTRGGGSASTSRALLGAQEWLILMQLLWQRVQDARFVEQAPGK